MSQPKRKILITGANGYIGGTIFNELKQYNYELFLGSRNKLINGQWRKFNILEPETFNEALNDIDTVIHLVSMSHQDCEKNPDLAQKVNTDMAQIFLERCIEKRVKKFIYFSTFHVYGPGAKGVITEETKTDPISIYARTHLETERLVLQSTAQKKIAGVVIRLSNALGTPPTKESSAWSLVANDLCRQAIYTKKIILSSTGLQKRDFIAAPCIADAVDILINKSPENGPWEFPVFNLGSESTICILELAKLIQTLCQTHFGFSPELLYKKIDENSPIPHDFIYSCQKIKSLGFSLRVSVEEELLQTLKSI